MTPQTLTLHPRASLDEALELGGLWESHAGGVAAPAPALFLADGLDSQSTAPHRQAAQFDGLGLMCVADALVFADGFAGNASGPFVSKRLHPGFFNEFIRTGARPGSDFTLDGKVEVALSGVSVLVHNCQAYTYGHWLLEGLPKLLHVHALLSRFGRVRFVVDRGAAPWVIGWIQLLVPDANIARYYPEHEFARCEKLVLPTLGFTSEYVFHDAVSAYFAGLAPPQPLNRLVYLDSETRSPYHWIKNGDEIRRVAQSLGFEVVYPATLSLEDQIAVFASAKVLAADYGSVLHNALFSPSETVVLAFNWLNWCQSRVAQLRKQRLGYQMGTTGAPVIRDGYLLDPDAARRAFDAAATLAHGRPLKSVVGGTQRPPSLERMLEQDMAPTQPTPDEDANHSMRVQGQAYDKFLALVHQTLKPETYFEIGTATGATLQLANCASIAVDPQFRIATPVIGDKPLCLLFQQTSDEFFSKHNPTQLLGGAIDIAFLDGMHFFEFLLRDFINTEKHCHRNSIMVLHDCLPPGFHMTARDPRRAKVKGSRFENWWTGDVWKLVPVLQTYRPDLSITVLDCFPTGLVVVTNPDPANSVLEEAYDAIVGRLSDHEADRDEYNAYWRQVHIEPADRLARPQELKARFGR